MVSAHPDKRSQNEKMRMNADQPHFDKDAEQTYWLYVAIQALRDGKLADNKQVDDVLMWVEERLPKETKNWTSEGRKVLDDIREIIEASRSIMEAKNADEIVQNFLYHTSQTSTHVIHSNERFTRERMEQKGQQLREGVDEVSRHMRTLLKLMLTNGEARGLLSDLTLIGREFVADAQEFIALFIRPRSEDLSRIDRAEEPPEDELHVLNASPQQNGSKLSAVQGRPENSRSNTSESSEEEHGQVKRKILRFLGRTLIKRQKRAREEEPRPMYPTDGLLPPERKDALIYRLKKVILDCQNDPAYQSSLLWLTSRIETYFEERKKQIVEGVQRSKTFFSDPLSNQAASELRVILERCANGASMNEVLDAFKKLVLLSLQDDKLRDWWGSVNIFVKRALLEPGFILSPEFSNQAQALNDQFVKTFRHYMDDMEIFLIAIENWFKSWGEDTLNKRLTDAWSQLMNDLFVEDDDVVIYKPHLWRDFRRHVLPNLVEQLMYIPAPRLEYIDEQYDLVIENLLLHGPNMFPKVFNFKIKNNIKVTPFTSRKDEYNHVVRIKMSQIYVDMHNVAFYFKKRTGFPRLSDSGRADVQIGGKGITIKVTLTSTTQQRQQAAHLFLVKKVDVKIHSLQFTIRDSKYDLLYNSLVHLATRLLKRHIARTLADLVTAGLEGIDSELVGIYGRLASLDTSGDLEIKNGRVLKEILRPLKLKSNGPDGHSLKHEKSNGTFRFVPIQMGILQRDPQDAKRWVRVEAEAEGKEKKDDGWRSDAFDVRQPLRTDS